MDNDQAIKFIREMLKSTGDDAELSDEEALDIIQDATESADDDWNDMLAMIEDMREHAKKNHRRVCNEDRPLQFRFGWRCAHTGKTWSIKMSALRESLELKETDPPKICLQKELIRGCIPTVNGRVALCHFLNAKP